MEIKIGGSIKGKCQLRFTNGKHTHLPLLTFKDITEISTISKTIMIDFLAIPFVSGVQDI